MVQHIVHNLKDCFTFVGLLLLDMVVRVVGILLSPRSPIFSSFFFYCCAISLLVDLGKDPKHTELVSFS